ncbi:MAG: D-alanine--D-alanine ligase [Spirochaetes bacterium]|nr:D-alanine--D-alanine ligase [Spirochaetota bacterium]
MNKNYIDHSQVKKRVHKKISLGIIYGGKSGEHDVSRCSAASVAQVAAKKYNVVCIGITRDGKWHVQNGIPLETHPEFGTVLALHATGQWHIDMSAKDDCLHLYNKKARKAVTVDVVFPLVHGTYGEDGTLQGLLEMAGVPYVGPGVLGSAVGMDKDIAKRIVQKSGVAIVPFETIRIEDFTSSDIHDVLQSIEAIMTVFIKPANAGSSVGISKVTKIHDVEKALKKAFTFDTKVIVEKAITCREFEVAVMGNEKPLASAVGEVIPQHEYYSYEAKYVDKDGAKLAIPANIPDDMATKLRNDACAVYKLLECEGMARVDFFVDTHDGTIYFNEVNTLPGFTSISMYPKLWEYSGVSYPRLIDTLISYAFRRHRVKKKVVKAFLSLKK